MQPNKPADIAEAMDNYRRNMGQLGMRPTTGGVVYIDPTDRGDATFDHTDEIIVCDTCHQNLNLFTVGGNETYVHSRSWMRYDHDPVPRAVARASITMQTCDYCGETAQLQWAFEGDRMRQGTNTGVHDFGTTWRACEPCSELIIVGDLETLLDRVMRVSVLRQPGKREHASEIRIQLINMWTMFLSTVHHRTFIGGRREPAKLNARMMPKLQQGLIKYWHYDGLKKLITKHSGEKGLTHSLPGVHCGDEERFTVQFPPGQPIPDSAWTNHAQHISAGILGSDLYWISANFTQLAIMAGKDFDKLVLSREELPSPFGFMVYEEPIGEIPRPGGPADIRAVSWTLVPQGVWINLYMQGEDGDPSVDVEEMRSTMGYLLCPNTGGGFIFNDEIPVPEDEGLDFITTLFATWFLMTQPGVADQAPAPVDKKYARSFQRQHNRKLPDVQLVDLRRQPHRSGQDVETREGRKLSVRVYRKGHWKRQAYGPKRGMRKTIYVNAYIAGPEGAPLKERPTTVNVLR